MPVSPELQLLRHLVTKTLTFPKMLEYYKVKQIDLVQEKLAIGIAQKMGKKVMVCPLCQRPVEKCRMHS